MDNATDNATDPLLAIPSDARSGTLGDVSTVAQRVFAGAVVACAIVAVLLVRRVRRGIGSRQDEPSRRRRLTDKGSGDWGSAVSVEELAGVEDLRRRVLHNSAADSIPGGARWYEDAELLRFFRARQTLHESEALFHEAMRWRQEHVCSWHADVASTGSFGVEHIAFTGLKRAAAAPPKAARRLRAAPKPVPKAPSWWCFMDKYSSTTIYGADRYGLPITYQCLGRDDLQGLVREIGFEMVMRYAIMANDAFLDAAREETQRTGSVVHGGSIIIDLDGLSLRRAYGEVIIFNQIGQLVKVLFPERNRHVYIVRAPDTFAALFKLLRHIIDPRTMAKISILGTGDSLQPLIDAVGAENVPNFLGGKSEEVPEPRTVPVPCGAFVKDEAIP